MDAVSVHTPGPLPVIGSICEEIGLVELINEQVTWDTEQTRLSPGACTKALIMNFLTEGVALYQMDEFFVDTDTATLFESTGTDEPIQPAHLNDHALRRGLDTLVEAGPRALLMDVLGEVIEREHLEVDVLHADTTTKSVQGVYEADEATDLSITHGHSKDHRRDLKQFKIGLGVTRTGVPVVGDILDGNASDTTWNSDLVAELPEWIDPDEQLIYVGDSKAFSATTLAACRTHGIELITRVPRTYSATSELVETAWERGDWTEAGPVVEDPAEDAAEYRLQSFTEEFHNRELRAIVVHSTALDGRTERSIERELVGTESALEDALATLEDRDFACEPDAQEALEEWLADHEEPYFTVTATVIETDRKKSRDKPGRPPKEWEPYETVYTVEAELDRDEEAIAEYKSRRSCFLLATTLEEDEEWTDETVLREYKDQQTVERRFPVLKDPKRVHAIYLDDPDRVNAMGYVLIMALVVYSIIERRARLALEAESEPMWLVGDKTSFRPTGRRVLERFQNVSIIEVDGKRHLPENDRMPDRVLELLGLNESIYGV